MNNKRSEQSKISFFGNFLIDHNLVAPEIVFKYNPCASPPNLALARQHAKSRRIGRIEQDSEICPCCGNYISKIPYPLCLNVGELSQYGSGYPLYFKLTKYYAIIILIVFLFSGSLTYLLDDMMCESKCVYFFGFKVFDLGKVDNFIQNQIILIVLIAIMIITAILYIKPRVFKDIKKYNSLHKTPCNYTIMVQNLPANMNKQEIKDFFTEQCKIYKQYIVRKYKLNKKDENIGQKIYLSHYHKQQDLHRNKQSVHDIPNQNEKSKYSLLEYMFGLFNTDKSNHQTQTQLTNNNSGSVEKAAKIKSRQSLSEIKQRNSSDYSREQFARQEHSDHQIQSKSQVNLSSHNNIEDDDNGEVEINVAYENQKNGNYNNQRQLQEQQTGKLGQLKEGGKKKLELQIDKDISEESKQVQIVQEIDHTPLRQQVAINNSENLSPILSEPHANAPNIYPIDKGQEIENSQEFIYFKNIEPIHHINMAYDIGQFEEAFESVNNITYESRILQQKLNQLQLQYFEEKKKKSSLPIDLQEEDQQICDPLLKNNFYEQNYRAIDIANQLKRLETEKEICIKKLELYQKQAEVGASDHFSGTVFITFNLEQYVELFLNQHGFTILRQIQYFFFRWIKNPYMQCKNNSLIIKFANNPADILWKNLNFSFFRYGLNNSLMIVIAFGILIASFTLQFIIMKYIYPYKRESMIEKYFDLIIKLRAMSLSLVVVLINVTLRLIVLNLTRAQKYESYTRQHSSYLIRYFLFYFFNSALLPYIVHGFFDKKEESTELLVMDIHFILLASAFSTPASRLFDIEMFKKFYYRIRLRKYKEQDIPYTQYQVNRIYETWSFDIADAYCYITRTLFLSCWYACVAPVGIIVALFGMLSNYWVDKILLLRVYMIPESVSEDITKRIINALELLPLIYICGNIIFEFRITITKGLIEFVKVFVYNGTLSVVLFICVVGFIIYYRKPMPQKELYNKEYKDIEGEFTTDYELCNPITQWSAAQKRIELQNKKKQQNLAIIKIQEIDNKKQELMRKKLPQNYILNSVLSVSSLARQSSQEIEMSIIEKD